MVLLEEGSVTRAARRLGITQSAASHQLRRLRELLADPLFVVAPKGLLPTTRLLELAEPLRAGLTFVQTALTQGQPFEPKNTAARFVVAGSDAVQTVALRRANLALRTEAPRVRIDFVPRTSELAAQLARGDIQLAIAPASGAIPGIDLPSAEL